MREVDRLAKIHEHDPPPRRVGRCAECKGYYRQENGLLVEHLHRDSGEPCESREQVPDGEPVVGFDTMYGVYYGGAWEMGKKR